MSISTWGSGADPGVASINNCTAKNMSVTEKSERDSAMTTGGGIVGFIRAKDTEIENCRVEGINVYNGQLFGGIVGSGMTSANYGEYIRRFKNNKMFSKWYGIFIRF